jgi:hypothetical protein
MCKPQKSIFFVSIILFLFIGILPFISALPSTAETSPIVPPEYGEVIYRHNEESPNQIFIIGLSHRDSLTCLNGDMTSRVQSEVFKIGDWLIHHQELGLLLPEGFFKSSSPKSQKNLISAAQSNCASYDMKILEKRLSDDKIYVNAEMLLKETHPIRLGQVEDKKLYDAVRASILKLASNQGPACDYAVLNSELEYLQERRTAAMLQKIPEIVNDEFQQGNIKNRKAIFTVGLFHIHEIIRFLNENRIQIDAPKPASAGLKDYTAELNLQKENFGITIILPALLTKDQKILEINKLTDIVNHSGSPRTIRVSSPSL